MFRQDKMWTTILLLALVPNQGHGLSQDSNSSHKLYRYDGVAMILVQEHSNMYMHTLQLCSLDKSTCEVGTTDEFQNCDDHYKFTMCKLRDNHTDFYFSMCHDPQGSQTLSSMLTSATNCPIITPTPATNMLYTMCTMTHTTTVSISSSVPPIPSMTDKTMQISILGAMVGILSVLLAIVTAGWVCTYWAMKKRRREININTTNIR